MKNDHVSKIFVFLVFVVVASIVVNDATLSGNVVAEQTSLDKRGEFDSRSFHFDATEVSYYEIADLKAGNTIYVVDRENKYALLALRVYENYELGDEHISLLISPGDKRLTLSKGQSQLIDFDNDQMPDVKVSLVSVTGESARVVFSNP
jgi:hypothetical protein